jgi:uncharacterized integral membrane protein
MSENWSLVELKKREYKWSMLHKGIMFTVVVVVLAINSFSRIYSSYLHKLFVAFHLFMYLQHVTFCL